MYLKHQNFIITASVIIPVQSQTTLLISSPLPTPLLQKLYFIFKAKISLGCFDPTTKYAGSTLQTCCGHQLQVPQKTP